MSSRDTHTPVSLPRRSLLRGGFRSAVGVGLAASGLSVLGAPGVPVSAATPPPPSGPVAMSTPAIPPATTPLAAPPVTPAPLRTGTPTDGSMPLPVTVVPTVAPTLPPSVPTAFQAYHNVTADTHQANFNNLAVNGYRMISLSISGDPNDPRYAAVWIQRPGSAFIAMHGVTLDEYLRRSNDLATQQYNATLLSATGPASNPRYAAVLEQGSFPNYSGGYFGFP